MKFSALIQWVSEKYHIDYTQSPHFQGLKINWKNPFCKYKDYLYYSEKNSSVNDSLDSGTNGHHQNPEFPC